MLRTSNTKLFLMAGVAVILAVVLYFCFIRQDPQTPEKLPPSEEKKKDEIEQTSIDPASAPTLALFHSDSCGHCKMFYPTWSKLKQYLPGTGIKIFEMDGNDPNLRNYGIRGFPTIRFYPKGMSGQFEDYKGDRSFDGIVNYIKSHGNQ